jgi:hypothetical protein
MTPLYFIERIPPIPHCYKTFDFGSHREVGRMVLIDEPGQSLHGA